MQLVHTYLHSGARLNPRTPSLISDGKATTYAEMLHAIDTIAEVLVVEGIRKGDTVLVHLHNRNEMLISIYAIMRVGAVALPLDANRGSLSIAELARRCSPEALITSRNDLRDHASLADQLRCRFMLIDDILESGLQTESASLQQSPDGLFHEFDRITKLMNIADTDGAILSSPGNLSADTDLTLLTHRQLVNTAILVNKFESVKTDRKEFILSSFSEISGFQRALCIHIAGGTVVSSDRTETTSDLPHFLQEHRCNGISIPAEFAETFIEQAEHSSTTVRADIRQIDISGGIPPADATRLLEIFPDAETFVHRDYAVAQYATMLHLRKNPAKIESVGKVFGDITIGISDEKGNQLARPHTGEVVIRLPRQSALPGNPFRRRQTAWLKTGDVGYLDRDGYLHIAAQHFEMITVNSIRFSPLMMEERIRSSFSGCEVGIVGVPDPAGLLGEIPVFCYHPLNGTQITSADLSLLLSKEFDQYQIPRIICRIDTFPRRGTILLRQELKQRVLAALSYAADPHAHYQPKNA